MQRRGNRQAADRGDSDLQPAAIGFGIGQQVMRDDLLVKGALDTLALLVFEALKRLQDRTHSNFQSDWITASHLGCGLFGLRRKTLRSRPQDGGPTATSRRALKTFAPDRLGDSCPRCRTN